MAPSVRPRSRGPASSPAAAVRLHTVRAQMHTLSPPRRGSGFPRPRSGLVPHSGGRERVRIHAVRDASVAGAARAHTSVRSLLLFLVKRETCIHPMCALRLVSARAWRHPREDGEQRRRPGRWRRAAPRRPRDPVSPAAGLSVRVSGTSPCVSPSSGRSLGLLMPYALVACPFLSPSPAPRHEGATVCSPSPCRRAPGRPAVGARPL